MPSIKDFEENMIVLHQDMQRNSEIIMRFDEVINEKANKVVINDVYENFSKYVSDEQFKDTIVQQDDKISQLKLTVEDLEDTFQKLSNIIDSEIKSAVRKQMGTTTSSKTSQSQNTTLGVSLKDFNDLLANKVNRSEMELVMDLKSNKTDTNTNMISIDIMHKQIKHLAVLIIEILKLNSMRYLKSDQSETMNK